MADETTQAEEETSWWVFDAFADSELPSTSFDEPLEWPEALDWGDFATDEGELQFPDIGDFASEPIFPEHVAPEPEVQRSAEDDGGDRTMPHGTVLSGLGGGGAATAEAGERLPDSLWAQAPAAGAGTNGNGNGHHRGAAPALTTTMAAPTFYAEADRGAGGWRRRFDLRHGNAAIIALISFVSLVLLGMFLSVRARNVPDTSQTRTTSDQIAVQGTLNTIPLTTTVTTVAPAPINIADLVPPAEDATTVTSGSGAGGGAGGSTATTAAPARSTPAAGGTTGTTQPPATTATTAAPQSTTQPETTSPPSPPADNTTNTTRPRTSTSVPMPSIPSITTVPDNDGPSYTIPSIPGFPTFPTP